MAQRYTPTKFYDPVFDDVATAALQADSWPALEYNTLILASEFETQNAQAVIVPWVLLKGSNGGVENADLWTPLQEITMRGSIAVPHASLGPLETDYYKAAAAQVEIPNCFEVRLLLQSISTGKVKVWAGLTNRAPR